MIERDQSADQDALRQRLAAALERLPRLTRIIYLLHRLDALSYEEVGWRCDISIDEVTNRMGDALYRLHTDAVGGSGSFLAMSRPMLRQWRDKWARHCRERCYRQLGIRTRS